MGTKRKDRITVGVTALILFGFLTGNIAKSDDTVSVSERRKLAQFPKINVENMKDGTFMSGFESYAKDQFPLREQFRALKTAFSMYVLGQRDQHGLYIKDGYIAKMEYPLHADSLQYAPRVLGKSMIVTFRIQTRISIWRSCRIKVIFWQMKMVIRPWIMIC